MCFSSLKLGLHSQDSQALSQGICIQLFPSNMLRLSSSVLEMTFSFDRVSWIISYLFFCSQRMWISTSPKTQIPPCRGTCLQWPYHPLLERRGRSGSTRGSSPWGSSRCARSSSPRWRCRALQWSRIRSALLCWLLIACWKGCHLYTSW